jgi:hypothetical protein
VAGVPGGGGNRRRRSGPGARLHALQVLRMCELLAGDSSTAVSARRSRPACASRSATSRGGSACAHGGRRAACQGRGRRTTWSAGPHTSTTTRQRPQRSSHRAAANSAFLVVPPPSRPPPHSLPITPRDTPPRHSPLFRNAPCCFPANACRRPASGPETSRLGWPARFTWQVEEGGSSASAVDPPSSKAQA